MNNVREGKSVNSLVSKAVTFGKALLISPTTLTTIDGKELVRRYDMEHEYPSQEVHGVNPDDSLLNVPENSLSHVIGEGVLGFNPNEKIPAQEIGEQQMDSLANTQVQIPTPNFMKPEEKNNSEEPAITPVSIQAPTIEPSIPVIPTPNFMNNEKVQASETQDIPEIKPVLKGGDEVVDAINTQIVTPVEPRREVIEPELQTPEQAFVQEESIESKFIDLIAKMVEMKQLCLDAIDGVRIETNRRLDEVKKKYSDDFDSLIRTTEKVTADAKKSRSTDMNAIKDAINEFDLSDQKYSGISINGR